MRFEPGQVIVRRYTRGPWCTWAQAMRVVTPQRRWEWKDADELDRRVGHPLYFDGEGARAIRSAGERVVELIGAGELPFDGTHTDFRPDPAWPVPRFGDGFA